jgi:CubicO group peptidase (beta-lactamase class C family)
MGKSAFSRHYVYRIALALLLLAFFVLGIDMAPVHARSNTTGDEIKRLDEYVQSEMQAASIPGLAYGIVIDGQVVHLAAFGVTGLSGQPMTTQTPMQIGSVGKTMTALAIRQLINAGKVDPDESVGHYIPWFRLADVQAAQRITIRDLLTHKSGLSTADGQDPTLYRAGPTSEALVRGLASTRLDRSVGSSFEYSNLNYLILGLVVQVASGQSYEQYVQEHIFDQLEMRHSYVSETAARQHGLAEGYRIVFGVPLATHVAYPDGLLATGYHISSAEDMAHYLAAFSNQGRYKGTSVVTPGDTLSGKDVYYDVDWNPIQLSDTGYGFGHSGKNPNYAAHMQIWPYGHLGVVVLTNANTSPIEVIPTKNASTIADDVFRMYQGFPLARPAQPISIMYIVIDILVLLAISALVWHGMRLRSWGKRVSRARSHLHAWVPSVLTDGILPLCLLLGPPIVLTILGDAPRFSPVKDWEMLLLIAPDIGYTLLAIASILLVIGTVKLVWVGRQLALGQGSRLDVNQRQVC